VIYNLYVYRICILYSQYYGDHTVYNNKKKPYFRNQSVIRRYSCKTSTWLSYENSAAVKNIGLCNSAIILFCQLCVRIYLLSFADHNVTDIFCIHTECPTKLVTCVTLILSLSRIKAISVVFVKICMSHILIFRRKQAL